MELPLDSGRSKQAAYHRDFSNVFHGVMEGKPCCAKKMTQQKRFRLRVS
jgi:hypothetical protein